MSLLSEKYQLKNYQLTIAEILYRMPDYPDLLQCFVWQNLDTAPQYPVLHRFLSYWEKNLDGPIFAVRVAGRDLFEPATFRGVDQEFILH